MTTNENELATTGEEHADALEDAPISTEVVEINPEAVSEISDAVAASDAVAEAVEETEAKLKKHSGSTRIEVRFLDLSKLESIHAFVDGMIKDNIILDATILNAGVALPKARKTESGQEEMFLVNYLSNVILCTLLLNKGLISHSNELKAFRPRLLFISSDSHQDSSYIDYDEFGKYID